MKQTCVVLTVFDSTKDANHAHFYIQNKPPFKYYCQRCGAKGIFNVNTMQKFKLTDGELVAFLNYNQIQYKKQQSYKVSTNIDYIKKKNYNYDLYEMNDNYAEKLIYIQNRLGLDIDEIGVNNFMNKYKVIVNLSHFLEDNNMTELLNSRFKFESQLKDLELINKNYVGFMSIDNNFITFRNIKNDTNIPRYKNIRLVIDEIENSQKLYMIRNIIDLSHPVYNVYITEGVFDIIGVHNHIMNCKMNDNDIYVAANGKSHLLVFNSLLSMGVTSCNINVYSDKDVNINFYRTIMTQNRLAALNGMNIYYNSIGKDYGVKKNEIVLTKPIIL